MNILVVYPGRFQPFHIGHGMVYKWLKEKFGNATIATSNKVEPPKSPFNFQEKKQMMTHAGVSPRDIKEVVNPYIAREILKNHDPKTTVLVFAVSEKDMAEDPRFSFKPTKSGKPGYLQPYKGNEKKLKPFGDVEKPRGYVVVTPTFSFDVLGKPMKSASEFRADFASANAATQKKMITDLYGKYSEEIHKLMKSKIKKPKTLKEMRELQEEITRKKFGPMLDAFVSFASDKLGLKSIPSVRYKTEDDDYNSFAAYNPSSNELSVSTKNRHPMDVFRSVAHELVHHKQNEDGRLGKDIAKEGATGSDIENEANSEAGKIMRWFAKEQPHHFAMSSIVESTNSAAIGGGIRGLGNVTGEVSPTVVSQYVLDNQNYTATLQDNTTDGLWTFNDHQWWMNSDDKKKYQAKSFKTIRSKMSLKEMSGAVGALAPKKEPETFASSLPKIKGGAVTKVIKGNDSSNMPVMKDAPRPKQPEIGATVTDTMVGGKKQKSISINPNVGVQLEEGINDPGILKAIFLAGGPGSGKDFVMNKALGGNGLREINSDIAFEYLMKKRGLDLEMPEEEKVPRDIVRGRAKTVTKEAERNALAGRQGLIINGTADDIEKIAAIKQKLEDQGYETMMVFVNTTNEVSRQRNVDRGKGGARKVPDGTNKYGVPDDSPNIRQEKWNAAQRNIGAFQKLFGQNNFAVIDNSKDIRKVTPEERNEIETDFNRIRRMSTKFVQTPHMNPKGMDWIAKEAKKRGIEQYSPPKTISQFRQSAQQQAAMPNVAVDRPQAGEMEQARRLGLSYYGFGRYGRKIDGQNTVLFVSQNGQLVRKQQMQEGRKHTSKLDESFEDFMSKPANREIGTDSLRKIYSQMTPGQHEGAEAPDASKRKKIVKKLNQEDNNLPRGKFGLPINGGYGPEYGITVSPALVSGATGIAESIVNWMQKSETIRNFVERYGDLAEEKLYEAAMRLHESGCGCEMTGPKSVKKIKESIKEPKEMGMYSGRGDVDEESEDIIDTSKTKTLKGYKKNIHPQSDFEKKTFAEESAFKKAFTSAREQGKTEFDFGGGKYSTRKSGESQSQMTKNLSDIRSNLTAKASAVAGPGSARSTTPETKTVTQPQATKPSEPESISGREALLNRSMGALKAKVASGIKDVETKLQQNSPNPTGSKADRLPSDHTGSVSAGDRLGPDERASYEKQMKPYRDLETKARKIDEETPAWQRKEGKNPEGGLNRKGIASYRRANPGSKLSMAVTTEPSKLKKGSKSAKRRLSFCRRMKGMKAKLTSAKTARDPNSRINKSLRKWNCEE